MRVWCLEGYDTGAREARWREYTYSDAKAEAWERLPRIQFTDSGHGIVFQAHRLEPGAKRERVRPLPPEDSAKLRELLTQVQRERRAARRGR
jgi:hypothetical protein